MPSSLLALLAKAGVHGMRYRLGSVPLPPLLLLPPPPLPDKEGRSITI